MATWLLAATCTLERYLVMMQLVTPVAIVTEALTTCSTNDGVQVDGFAKPLEPAEELGNLQVQIDEHLIFFRRGSAVANEDGRELRVGPPDPSVGQEALLAEGPEQTVDVLRLSAVGREDENAKFLSVVDSLGQAAGEEETVTPTAFLQGVEIDPGHCVPC
jgi:hypothetical protein